MTYFACCFLTISVQCCISYRNRTFDLQNKSNDWCLYKMQHKDKMGEPIQDQRSHQMKRFVWSGTIYAILKTWKNGWLLLTPLLITFLHGCFSRFLNCANGTKSLKASHIETNLLTCTLLAGIYLFKVNNGNTRIIIGKFCSKLTIKTLERRLWCSVLNVVSVLLFLTPNKFHILLWCFHC